MMSVLGEAVLRRIYTLRRSSVDESALARHVDCDRYIRWQFDTSPALFSKYPEFDIRGKTVLDLGCGTGGRAAWLAQAGAARVVGIDLNAAEINVAREAVPRLYPDVAGRVEFLACGENDRLSIGPFDVVLLIDSMEHVVSPPQMMRLAYDYTNPGGRCYFSCYGFYHHAGSHMGLVPFDNVFFSDETILNVTRWLVSRPDYVPHRFDSDPPLERWRGIYDLRDRPGEHLNKLTLRQMKLLTRHSIFRRARMTVIGFGHRRKWLRFLDWMKDVPLLQEVWHSYVVVDLER